MSKFDAMADASVRLADAFGSAVQAQFHLSTALVAHSVGDTRERCHHLYEAHRSAEHAASQFTAAAHELLEAFNAKDETT